ncbi:hypothetical protein AAFF_G00185260 [Aldrovandia affinis]|uniref:Uncharacterized protein n=1 Tax=Aldrovandia affinis TaxID=143900 RepID=A0AAD7W6G5_9TELE|nr:hypothetical protein AAFF_G00185260 [Aldrovandia affinis]
MFIIALGSHTLPLPRLVWLPIQRQISDKSVRGEENGLFAVICSPPSLISAHTKAVSPPGLSGPVQHLSAMTPGCFIPAWPSYPENRPE